VNGSLGHLVSFPKAVLGSSRKRDPPPESFTRVRPEGEAPVLDTTTFWIDRPGAASLRPASVREPAEGEVLVRTLWTGISRGTETTVFRGRAPASEHDRMRAPFQQGSFPGPVAYGYCNVGVVEVGPPELRGRTVFTLFPHQSRFVVPESAVVQIPAVVPARRAVLAAAVETAVNVLWDARPRIGDRITVIGAGMIGAAVARLAHGVLGTDVLLVDIDPARRATAEALGVRFDTEPPTASSDLVVHTSGTDAGLAAAVRAVVDEGTVIEASWFGDRPVSVPLGEDFHTRRLTIRASQVGRLPVDLRDRRTTGERLALAVRLLADPAFDALLGATAHWRDLPDVMRHLAETPSDGTCTTIDWSDAA
jgi:threonine dehydrogenase-like Zn-dependent dehydrogenase